MPRDRLSDLDHAASFGQIERTGRKEKSLPRNHRVSTVARLSSSNRAHVCLSSVRSLEPLRITRAIVINGHRRYPDHRAYR